MSRTQTASSDQLRADLALLLMTVIWGVTFPAVKVALLDAPPFVFLFVRFCVASAFFLGIAGLRLVRFDRALIAPGLLLGATFFMGFAFQTAGLSITTASRSGFITGLAVVFVPFFASRLERRPLKAASYVGVALAVIGLWFITSPGTGANFNRGDLLTLFCALSFALQIVLVQLYTKRHDYLQLMFIQFVVTIALSLPCSFVFGEFSIRFTSRLAGAIAYTALVATVLAIWIQFRYQRLTTATRAALIYTLEPVFAALFAFLLLGERMHGRAWVGAAIILVAIALSEKGGQSEAKPLECGTRSSDCGVEKREG